MQLVMTIIGTWCLAIAAGLLYMEVMRNLESPDWEILLGVIALVAGIVLLPLAPLLATIPGV